MVRTPVMTRRIALILLTVMSACASLGPRQPRPSPKTEHNVLTRDEILNSSFTNVDLYQAIRGLRPHFLAPPAGVRSRASTASSPTVVYVDRMRQSGLEALRTLRTSQVEEVRYLDPTAAQSEFGAGASGGALMIKLHKP